MDVSNNNANEQSLISESKVTLGYFLKNLWLLWFKPNHFFNRINYSISTASIIFCAYILGVFSVADRIDTKILSHYEGGSQNEFMLTLAHNWTYYWGFLLVVGMVSAAVVWLFWGWIFNLRLKWSGDSEVEPTTGRHVYVITNLVVTLPYLISLIVALIRFPDYITYYHYDVAWSMAILVFLVWYYVTQFLVVKNQFNVNAWKAAFWFLILPLLINGLLVYIYLTSIL